ncbi:hypothetical protein BDD12DRAFT_352236 [Trichophaea hybrida]|nr:hypothetical protein BDD12DRAFT_352236 [Trichophaea hybrida]
MPILRRYVRVSKYTVLEARIFLPNPTDVPWFTRTEAIARVFDEIKHLVLPMLAEAKLLTGAARVKAREKQVVVGEDFEVSIYLTRAGSLHSILRKDRRVETRKPIQGNSMKLIDAASSPPDVIPVEEEEEDTVDLTTIPEAPHEEPLFLPGPDLDDDSDDDFVPLPLTPAARKRSHPPPPPPPTTTATTGDEDSEDKKKLKFTTEYEGFTIYDKVLCLVVTHKQKRKATENVDRIGEGLIEGWIAMSQAVRDGDGVDGDGDGDGDE